VEKVIIFEDVYKYYSFYHHIYGGIKSFLFNLPKAINQMKNNKFWVLKGVSFEVYKGETLGIIGRNGTGKSTTLGLIAGVIRPSKGRIIVKGKISPLLELGSGFHPDLTGRENIILNGILLGMTKKEIMKKIDQIIEFSELGEFIEHPIRTYSTGMLARLGFSIAIHVEPEILLIDEILAVGDVQFQKKCIDRMLSFKKRGISIVFVSHDMGAVNMICDRVIWLDSGSIKMEGKPSSVTKAYQG